MIFFEPQVLAAAGATFLDEAMPGWAARINTDKLDLGHTCGCVLGQLHGDFEVGAKRLALDARDVITHGFFVEHPFANVRTNRYARLTTAWKAEIAKRKTANMDERPTRLAA